ncbi:hypothetical protein, partial [Escherichia coli]
SKPTTCPWQRTRQRSSR